MSKFYRIAFFQTPSAEVRMNPYKF